MKIAICESMGILLVIVSILVMFLGGYLLTRNEWIYKNRVEWIEENVFEYQEGPSYGQMHYRFWCWDFDKLKKLKPKK